MTAVIALFAVGLVLLAIEVVLPGGFLAALSAICLLAGVVAAFIQLGAMGGGIATGAAMVLGAATLYFEFVVLPKTRLARSLSMSETVSGRSQPEVADPAAVVGAEAIALTTLAPGGYVESGGHRYEAFCQSGHVEAGTRLRIVDVDTFRVVVTQIKEVS